MSKLVLGKKVSEMTDGERREAECFFASHAIRDAMLPWGPGWERLDPETREACLMLSIVKYMCGQRWYEDGGMPRQRGVGWDAEDCWRVLEVCKHWSMDGTYGPSLARMAAE